MACIQTQESCAQVQFRPTVATNGKRARRCSRDKPTCTALIGVLASVIPWCQATPPLPPHLPHPLHRWCRHTEAALILGVALQRLKVQVGVATHQTLNLHNEGDGMNHTSQFSDCSLAALREEVVGGTRQVQSADYCHGHQHLPQHTVCCTVLRVSLTSQALNRRMAGPSHRILKPAAKASNCRLMDLHSNKAACTGL